MDYLRRVFGSNPTLPVQHDKGPDKKGGEEERYSEIIVYNTSSSADIDPESFRLRNIKLADPMLLTKWERFLSILPWNHIKYRAPLYEELRRMSIADLKALASRQTHGLTEKQIVLLKREQVEEIQGLIAAGKLRVAPNKAALLALMDGGIQASTPFATVNPVEIASILSSKNLDKLTPDQISLIRFDLVRPFIGEEAYQKILDSMNVNQLAQVQQHRDPMPVEVTVDNLPKLTNFQVNSLTKHFFEKYSLPPTCNSFASALTGEQIRALDSIHLNYLSSGQIAALAETSLLTPLTGEYQPKINFLTWDQLDTLSPITAAKFNEYALSRLHPEKRKIVENKIAEFRHHFAEISPGGASSLEPMNFLHLETEHIDALNRAGHLGWIPIAVLKGLTNKDAYKFRNCMESLPPRQQEILGEKIKAWKS